MNNIPREPAEPDKRLTRAQAAEFLGTTTNTLAVWASTHPGKIPCHKQEMGNGVYYLLSELERIKPTLRSSPNKRAKRGPRHGRD